MASSYKTVAEEFNELDKRRAPKLQLSREAAALTIPGLLPEENSTGMEQQPQRYSSMGAKGVISLSSRVTNTILPLNGRPFYGFDTKKIENDPQAVKNPTALIRLKQKIADIERDILQSFYASNYRSALYTASQHLIVVGDCVLFQDNDGDFTLYRLDNYVVRRDPSGNLRTLIIREWLDCDLLPPELANIKKNTSQGQYRSNPQKKLEPHFIHISLDVQAKKWNVTKEFRDTKYETGKSYPQKASPYVVLRWSEVIGEDYGRSLVEENIAHFRSTEGIAKSLVESIAALSEFRIGVNPGGMTKVDDLADSENGDFVAANKDDVFVIRAELEQQVNSVFSALQAAEKEIGRIFLMDSVVQPQQERVTATQARIFATEITSTLGGPISQLDKNLQKPIVMRRLEIMKLNSEIPPNFIDLIDKDLIGLKMRTGIEALNKEIQYATLSELIQAFLQLPEEAQEVLNWGNITIQYATVSGADTQGLIYSEEEIAQRRQAKAQMETQQYMAQKAADAASTIAAKQSPQSQVQ